jgi:hypothetical protein
MATKRVTYYFGDDCQNDDSVAVDLKLSSAPLAKPQLALAHASAIAALTSCTHLQRCPQPVNA